MKYKYRLMAPGPTPVPENVLCKMAEPILHHRTPGFEAVVAEVREGLKWLYQTKQEVILLAASGTAAMEGCITSLLNKEDTALVVDGGKFGERWWKICQSYGVKYDVIKVEWGKAVDPKIIEAKLKEKDYRAVYVQASETSTAVAHPIKEIAQIVQRYENTALIVDAITALGVVNIPFDEWKIDALITGSQKALMLPPGLACVGLSEKFWRVAEKANLPRFYIDFKKELKSVKENTSAYTPAVSIITGLKEVLKMLKEEGMEAIFKRHATLAEMVRQGLKGMELKLYAPESPSTAVTAAYSPEGIDSGKIVKGLRENFNMTIANGQDQAKGKIFRIGHLGYYDPMDMVSVLAAVETTLIRLGHKIQAGQGVGAALKVIL